MPTSNKDTKLYSFRLDIELMNQVREKADEEGETMTSLIERYIKAGLNETSSDRFHQSSNAASSNTKDLLHALIQALVSPETSSTPDGISPCVLESITQQIAQLSQKVDQFDKKIDQLTNCNTKG